MEYDLSLNEADSEEKDIIYAKINKALNESKNILHKKALILIKSIHSQFDAKKLIRIDGVQLYTKTFIDLLLKIVAKYSEINAGNLEEDELIEDILNIYCYKYILNIIESFILSRTNEELSNDKDEIVIFFKNIYMKILIICMRAKSDYNYKDEYNAKNINFNMKDLQSNLLKIIVGLIQKKGELIQFGSPKFPDWPAVVKYLNNHQYLSK